MKLKQHASMSKVVAPSPRYVPTTPKLRPWDYLVAQVTTSARDEVQHAKHERVYNFLHVPQKLERLLFLGYFVCLDSFLYNFTILPVRIFISLLSFAHTRLWRLLSGREPQRKLPLFGSDVLKGLLLLSVMLLLQQIDASRVYHSIRGQSVIKLYVIFNVFEVLDKLCCSFGLDILDSFFSKSQVDEPSPTAAGGSGDSGSSSSSGSGASRLHPAVHFLLTICYVFIHTMVLFFQAITLNVSINSFSNALLTLLVSNQFVEIKSAVFKKFEKENLFQLSCADILERFQLSVYLVIIGFRNVTEVSATLDLDYLLFGLAAPLGMVFISELIVDWLKHAFITKFNHIHPDVYLRFMDTLCRDLEGDPAETTLADQSPAVSRRIGFSSLPLTCLLVRIVIQTMKVSEVRLLDYPYWMILAATTIMFMVKIAVGMGLISYTRRRNAYHDYRLPNAGEAIKARSLSADVVNSKPHKA